VRNSSLVKWFCAENVTGLKSVTEASDCQVFHLGIAIFAAVRPPNVTFQRELGPAKLDFPARTWKELSSELDSKRWEEEYRGEVPDSGRGAY
jgi:hypothetical protein